jgi:hypothetical protein
VDRASTLLARADGLAGALGPKASLTGVEQLRPVVARFAEKLVPLRVAATSGSDPQAWLAWLRATSAAGLHDLGAVDAAAAVVAVPGDAQVLEAAGIVLVNGAADAQKHKADPRFLRDRLRTALDAFSSCVAADPEHPRCGEHLATTRRTLDAVAPE